MARIDFGDVNTAAMGEAPVADTFYELGMMYAAEYTCRPDSRVRESTEPHSPGSNLDTCSSPSSASSVRQVLMRLKILNSRTRRNTSSQD